VSNGTDLATTQSRIPTRAARKRDERVRRVVRRIKKHATWLNRPHFATPLYTYGALWVRFVDLHSVKAEPIDELGWTARPQRGRRARHGAVMEADHEQRRRIAAAARGEEEVVEPTLR
jgi:hypothetical protein